MELLQRIREVTGPGGLLTGDDVRARSTGFWDPTPMRGRAIVRPADTAQLAGIVAMCRAAGQPMVVHGGLTGLVQGANATDDEIAISLERMTAIESIDPVDRTMTVQAGAVLATLQDAAADAGLFLPLDLGGRGSCTIGGNLATNAGGNRVIRYGMTRESVLGLEAVLPDGRVLTSMNRMIKNNAGYDLKHLFIGTEGTLGIITRAVLRLREAPASEELALVGLPAFDAVIALLRYMDSALGGTLSAFELMWNEFYRLTTTPPAPHNPPLGQEHPFYVLLESTGGDPDGDRVRFEHALGHAMEQGWVSDAVLASSAAERTRMWSVRDDVAQAMRLGPMIAFDVSLPVSLMRDYVDEVRSAVANEYPRAHLFALGHIGDGNLHFAVCHEPMDDAIRHGIEGCVYRPPQSRGGSVSAEHGIGFEKKGWLGLCRSPPERELMRTLKRTFDPDNLLNRGRVFDLD